MRLIFYYGNSNKTVGKNQSRDSKVNSIKRLTTQNKKFLELLGLTVIRDYPKK